MQRVIAGSVLAVAVTVLVLALWQPAHRVWLTWTLDHGDPGDQVEAALALGKLEYVEAIPALLRRLETARALLSTEGDAEEPDFRKHLSSLCSRAEASVLQLVKLPTSQRIVESHLATARSGTAFRLLEACRFPPGHSDAFAPPRSWARCGTWVALPPTIRASSCAPGRRSPSSGSPAVSVSSARSALFCDGAGV